MRRWLFTSLILFGTSAFADDQNPGARDKAYINEVENPEGESHEKVLHAEPLYIDLIRDLGARAGELEVNLGYGLSDKREFVKMDYLAEIEWAPINRLGVEFELPVTDFVRFGNASGDEPARQGLASYKLAAQYTWFVSEKFATSSAVGYLHEFLRNPAMSISDAAQSGNGNGALDLAGNLYNPFFVVARRWGNNWHSLLYTGPRYTSAINRDWLWQNNMSVHYMLTGTRHFIGLEVNQEFKSNGEIGTVFRPQMRLQFTDQVLVGIVTGIPANLRAEGLSTFLRLIYELP